MPDPRETANAAKRERIVLCGSRGWTDETKVVQAIDGHPRGAVFLHGAARGADEIAGRIASGLGYEVEVWPANWNGDGRAAGFIRNVRMLESPADKVIAFWDGRSPGTAHTIREAQKRGIPVEVVS